MKKVLSVIVGFLVLISFCGCKKTNDNFDYSEPKPTADSDLSQSEQPTLTDYPCMEGSFSLKDGVYENQDGTHADENTVSFINNAKSVLSLIGYECSFENAKVEYKNDEWNFREIYTISTVLNENTLSVSFRKDNKALVKIDSGNVTSDNGNVLYTSNDVDALLNIAKNYYQTLPVSQGYEISNYQIDFGGPDWQVDFSKKIDIDGYDKPVYNYTEHVRMRISGTDGSLLSLIVFDTPLETKPTDTTQITYEQALAASGLDNAKLKESYIGCYTLRDKGYSRLCWCLTYDYSSSDGTCDERTVYIDLYDGVQIGYENCL